MKFGLKNQQTGARSLPAAKERRIPPRAHAQGGMRGDQRFFFL